MFELNRRSFLIGTAALGAQLAANKAYSAGDTDPLDTAIAAIGKGKKAVGVSACAFKDGKLRWTGASGWANVRNKTPMTPDTIQNIGSISKTVTATAVMKLYESGDVALDGDINDYLPLSIRNPRYPKVPITVRHLLTHQSSIVDGPVYDASYTCGDPTVSLHDWIESLLTPKGKHYNDGRHFRVKKPGARHRYSNVGYGVLGLIGETVSGQSFDSYCQDHIFKPLGMANTGWRIDSINQSTHATLYERATRKQAEKHPLTHTILEEEGLVELCLYSFPNYPDGLVRTSVTQFARFLAATMDHSLLQPATMKQMLHEEVSLGGGAVQGLCWAGREVDGHMLWGHDGGDPGVDTLSVFNPKTRAGALVFSTGSYDPAIETLLKDLMDYAQAG